MALRNPIMFTHNYPVGSTDEGGDNPKLERVPPRICTGAESMDQSSQARLVTSRFLRSCSLEIMKNVVQSCVSFGRPKFERCEDEKRRTILSPCAKQFFTLIADKRKYNTPVVLNKRWNRLP